MKVLLAHVRYRDSGGEDRVFDDQARLLRDAGLDVAVLDVPPVSPEGLGPREAVRIAVSGGDHGYGRALLREAVRRDKPDVVHFHNIHPLLGLGAMREARRQGCVVVRTLHNYRLSCVAGTHFYEGAVCDRCRPAHAVPGIMRGCYRDSRLLSALTAAATRAEWRAMIEEGLPDIAVCPAEFPCRRIAAFGVPEERLVVAPNSVDPPAGSSAERDGAVFVGRLSEEKGVRQLIEAWPSTSSPMTVIGDGPLSGRLPARENVRLIGRAPSEEVRDSMARARVLVLPSLAFEGAMPLVALEAFAEGTPVVCFDHGALSEVATILSPECVAPSGAFDALAQSAANVLASDAATWRSLSDAARAAYERSHTHGQATARLLAVYSRLVDGRAVST